VTAVGLAADYNNDGTVDAADYVVWRKNLGSSLTLPNDDTPGVGPDDYARWRTNFGRAASAASGTTGSASAAVPEPTTLSMFVAVLIGCCLGKKRQSY
jgi:hypothetical protein